MSPKPTTVPPSRNLPQASHTTTVLLFLLILVSFFPGIFHYLWSLPLALVPASLAPSSFSSTTSADCPDCVPSLTMGSWYQKQFTLPSKSRGSYLVTDHVVSSLPEIKDYKVGLLNLFIQHTSCALSLNENWDDDVRADMSDALDRIAPEAGPKGEELYRHSAEGPDDMPAHVKSALIGASVTIPIRDGKLATGTWQGIWYLEFRAMKHQRRVVATIQGEKA
ncbi:hypothetical protein BD289DRAFT_422973 [Coniella lustricola]|uniref:Uncharacterized protein n=1 Tax=Coniella lustricola TaxID=2025994 RepID=A0A2T3AK92_9PEZI|nr:hypothetical protein BD289DRAFT_422973 [Coniella lustricola]